jgi:Tfp pilus assembly protein PilV
MTSTASTGAARRRSRADGGFTVIESLTASAILLVIAVGVVTVLVTTAGWYANARLRTQAYAAANQVMANILSRNYAQIKVSTTSNATYPQEIPASMSWPQTGTAEFTVLTSMETTTDEKTGLDMTLVSVSAIPVGQSLDPTVTVTRYASGWQTMATSTDKFPVTVKVQLYTPSASSRDVPPWDGARVQLLDVNDLHEVAFALTDADGVATMYNVPEDRYYLTCDWRFGSNIRAVNFPTLIVPTHGGSSANPINTVNGPYNLAVTKSSVGAVLRVGAFETRGWTIVDNSPQQPEIPYKYPAGLIVYASPVLNTGSAADLAYYGTGGAPLYEDETKLPVYSATVNAYGIAAIPVPYTINPDTQHWNVWCRTIDSNNETTTVHKITTTQPGQWTTDVQRPEGAYTDDTGLGFDYGNIPQFVWLGADARAANSAAPPTFP